jgi:hypothetical protein
MKKILILILTLIAVPTFSQKRLVEISKEYITKEVSITDGLVYKYSLGTQGDTARYFNPGADVYEATIIFKKKGTTPPPDVIIEKLVDSEEGVIFSAGWTFHGTTQAAGWYKGTLSYSVVANSIAAYTFTGRQIELYAELKSDHGTGKVSIDNGPETTVSFKGSPTLQQQLIYKSPVLTDGVHTIILKANGDGPVLLDYFKVYNKQ